MFSVRTALFVLLFGLLGIVLQGTLLRSFLPAYLVPNFLLMIVVYLGFNEVSVFGALLVFGLGMLLDMSSGVLLGPWAGAFIIVFTALSSLSQRIFVESGFTAFISLFVGSLLSNFVYVVLLYEFRPMGAHTISVSILEALVTASLGPLVFKVLGVLRVKRGTSLIGGRLLVSR